MGALAVPISLWLPRTQVAITVFGRRLTVDKYIRFAFDSNKAIAHAVQGNDEVAKVHYWAETLGVRGHNSASSKNNRQIYSDKKLCSGTFEGEWSCYVRSAGQAVFILV